jgi:acetylornithine deacetylase/succinyl-diaminopimelate desuccinylase-like protein
VGVTEEVGLETEVLDLTRALIRLDTSNPPGNETPAAELLADYLEAAGVECELIGPDPARLNLVGRLRGSGGGPSLALLAHTDVVPAPAADWTVPPFAAEVRAGKLVGRGAVDMKGELAARAVAMAALARSGVRTKGDAVIIAEADEERNTADVGMSWLVRERPDLRCDYAINEGGGLLLELADGRRVVTVSVGEKQVTSLRIRIRGEAGHASVPAGADNPLGHLASATERLLAYRHPVQVVPAVNRALSELGESAEADEEAVARAGLRHPILGELMHPMTSMTVTPTGTRSYEPANVIPPFADLICDCRAMPGQTESDIRERIADALGAEIDYELKLLEPLEGGTESPIDTPLYRVLEEYVAERVPGASLLPILSTGFTDSHWVRCEHGTVAYGFAPVLSTDPVQYSSAAHGADESIEVADLTEMARFHLRALRELLRPTGETVLDQG